MSELTGITAASLRRGHLRGIIGPGARFENVPDLDLEIEDSISKVEREVELELSTRCAVTTFKGVMTHEAPASLEAELVPTEWEGPYAWPPRVPGDGLPRFALKARPVVSIDSLVLILPGGIQYPVTLPVDWVRLDHIQGELMLAPSLVSAPLQAAGYTGPLILGLTNRQLPMSVLISYKAGLGAIGLRQWPQVSRLIGLLSAIRILPMLSTLLNPDVLTSQSADGLSESRASGYAYKDLDERLQAGADKARESLLALWDGPGLMVL